MQLAVVSNKVTCLNWTDGSYVGEYVSRPQSRMPIRSLAWANTSGWLCVCNDCGELEIISFANSHYEGVGRLLRRCEQFTDIHCATFQNHSKRNLAFAQDDHILLYDIQRQNVRKRFPALGDGSRYTHLQYETRDLYLCAVTNNDCVYTYNMTGLFLKFDSSAYGRLNNYAVDNHGNFRVATCTQGGAVIVWDIQGNYSVHKERSVGIRDVAFDSENRLVYITDNNRMVFRDDNNAAYLFEMRLPFVPKCMDLADEGYEMGVCSEDDEIYALDIRKLGHVVYQLPTRKFDLPVKSIIFSRDIEHNVRRPSTTLITTGRKLHTSPVPSCPFVPGVHVQPEPVGSLEDIRMEPSSSRRHVAAPSTLMRNMHVRRVSSVAVGVQSANEESGDTRSNVLMRNEDMASIRSMVLEVVHEEMANVTADLKAYVNQTIMECSSKCHVELQVMLLKEFAKLEQLLQAQAPQAPQAPAAPEASEAPQATEVPEASEESEGPEATEAPEASEASEEPGAPETSEEYEVSDEPEAPAAPETPEELEALETSEAPEAPEHLKQE